MLPHLWHRETRRLNWNIGESMAVTVAPSVEAVREIVDRINTASSYALPLNAKPADVQIDVLENITGTLVEVVAEAEETLQDTLNTEDRSSHQIRVYFRSKLNGRTFEDIASRKLCARQIFQRVNNHNSSDGRVKVWECDFEPNEVPIKDIMRQTGVFVCSIVLRVEVDPA